MRSSKILAVARPSAVGAGRGTGVLLKALGRSVLPFLVTHVKISMFSRRRFGA